MVVRVRLVSSVGAGVRYIRCAMQLIFVNPFSLRASHGNLKSYSTPGNCSAGRRRAPIVWVRAARKHLPVLIFISGKRNYGQKRKRKQAKFRAESAVIEAQGHVGCASGAQRYQ